MYTYVKENWSSVIYAMDIAKDTFIHFTPQSRAEQILSSGRLLKNPPYKKFGIDAVTAISLSYGSFKGGVQYTHISNDSNDPIVAIVFKTRTLPQKRNYVEEVYWHEDVILDKPKIISVREAKSLLNRSTPPPHKKRQRVFYCLYRI